MDPFSQAALGAVVGQAAGYRQLGYRAAVLGAVAGALPDVDVLFSVGGDYFDQLVRHRGITHALLFAPLAGPLLGYVAWRFHRRRTAAAAGGAGTWMAVATLALLSHPLLDVLTPYGTQLLLPFSDARFAVNAMPIIDPLYTLMLLAGLVAGVRLWPARARGLALATLAVSSAYLGYAAYLNDAAERAASRQLADEGVRPAALAAFPTILQIHYRRVVARTPDQDRVGFVSMWRPCEIQWQTAPRNAPAGAVAAFQATREGRIFHWFTMGWARYRLEPGAEAARLTASDLRYGFTDDPDRSIFTASADVDARGRLAGPVDAGRDATDASLARLGLLFRDTYAVTCLPAGR